MAKKTASKKATKSSAKANPKLMKAATVAAGKAIGKASGATRKPAKPTVTGRAKAAVARPMARVVKVKQTLASKVKTAAHDAGLVAATAVGATLGAVEAVKDVVTGGNGKKPKKKAKR